METFGLGRCLSDEDGDELRCVEEMKMNDARLNGMLVDWVCSWNHNRLPHVQHQHSVRSGLSVGYASRLNPL